MEIFAADRTDLKPGARIFIAQHIERTHLFDEANGVRLNTSSVKCRMD